MRFLPVLALLSATLPSVAMAQHAKPTPPPPANLGCPATSYQMFYFMLGDWMVGPTGKSEQPARAQWTALGPCAMVEHWMPSNGQDGYSLNYFDQADGKWHQQWVDASGDAVHYVGEWKDGKMSFTAQDVSTPSKEKVHLTMTFQPLPDGSVRQTGTISKDGGKTYEPNFDLTYVLRR